MPKLMRPSYPAFTITEVMLSGFLLTVGILSVMSLFAVAHQHARDTRNVMIATALAQEGIEVARNIRDNAIATKVQTGNASYDVFTNFPNGMARDRTVTYSAAGFTNPGNTWLSYDPSGLQYHSGSAFTGFYRIIRIDHTGSSDTARVQSFVTWQNIAALPNNATATSWCTPTNKCVYTELLLTAWK